jgi:hypothetical protein
MGVAVISAILVALCVTRIGWLVPGTGERGQVRRYEKNPASGA